jgi:hypothetical protein
MKSNFIILFIIYIFITNLSFLKNNQKRREIYYDSSFPWYVFYDSNNSKCDIVEIGGVKYGFIDRLKKVNNKDTISKSKYGILFNKNNEFIYLNFELNKEFNLKKVVYKPNHKSKRDKIFSTYSYIKIRNKDHITKENKSLAFKIASKDFEYFENNKLNSCEKFDFELYLDSIK